MAIIYSYPPVVNLQTTDLFIISRLPEDPEEISNYSVTLNSLSTYIIDQAFNGTNNYIPKFDGTASLVNSIIYQDDDGHVGIGVPGSTPNPVHKFEVYDDRSENVSSDYTQVNSTVVGPPWTGGAGGILSRLSTDGGGTFPYGISLIPGTTASDIAASGRLAFFANSNLDTSAATGYSGQVTFDGTNPHWILGGNLTDTTTRTLHVKGDMLVDTDLEVDGGLDVAGTVRLGFTGNDPVILGDPNGKRTEWNNPGYLEIYAENPYSPGDFNETVDIDGDYYGGGFVGVYPANTENAHGVRMHTITDVSSAPWGSGFTSYFHNFIDVAKANRQSPGTDEQNIRISDVYSVRTTGEIDDYAGIKISHPTDNRFRFNSEFSTEPTVPFLVNSSSKFVGQVTIPETPVAGTDAASKAYVDSQNTGQVTGTGTTDTLPLWSDGPNGVLADSILSQDTNPPDTGLVLNGDRIKVDGTAGVKDSLTINYTDGTFPRPFPVVTPGGFFETEPTGRVGVVNNQDSGEWAFSAVSVANGANFTNRSGLLHSNVNAYRLVLANTTEENIRLNSDGNSFIKGRLAIGHDTPTEYLDVDGSARVSGVVETDEITSYGGNEIKLNNATFFGNGNICNTDYTDIGATLHLRTDLPLAAQSVIALTRGGQGTGFPSGITQDNIGDYQFILRDKDNVQRIRFNTREGGVTLIDNNKIVLSGNTDVNAYGAITINGRKWSDGVSNAVMEFNKTGTQADNALEFRISGVLKGSITYDGTGTSYNVTSDYRLKENVVEITDGIERLKQLKPSRFNFISNTEKVVDGFIAHEVESVIPEAVTGEKDATEEYEVTPAEYDDYGNIVSEAVMGTRNAYQQIDQAKIVPLLTAALQEAVSKIESLEARIQILEGN